MPRKHRTSPAVTIAIIGLGLAGLITFCFMQGCNTLDSPYEDAARASAAGAQAPVVDAAAVGQALFASCYDIYLESEARDYFETQVGDPFEPGEMHCGDDPLWFWDQTWNCEVFGVDYTVVRYSQESELPFETRRTVIPSRGTPWSFQCKYDSGCLNIRCKRI